MDKAHAIFLHQSIRMVCLLGSATAVVVSAVLGLQAARIGVEYMLPTLQRGGIPALTEFWVVGVSDGSTPLLPCALALAASLVGAGCFTLFSKKISSGLMTTLFGLICCVGYTVALLFLASFLLALAMPFVPIL
ncbi:MAG TPA: hypothetical protein VLD18_00500 [Verrucomicrobiae bacterium]|nr:hypothetical protein [Verrucomicrobiae bacterium]